MAHSIAIIGVGPRGVYALDHLTRALAAAGLRERVDVHLIEPNELGAGQVYRTTQPEYLLTNTIASQLTAFADQPLGPDDPFGPGLPLHAWLTAIGAPMGPDETPSRATYGRYLANAVREICGRATAAMTLHVWRCRALDVRRVGDGHQIVLEGDFSPLMVDQVLLTTGHSAHANALHEALSSFAAAQASRTDGRTQFHPSIYPVEQRIAPLRPGARLGILGMGLTAIDGIIAATEGRGGRFTRTAEGRLTYQPSGQEPRIVCWSLPGLPPSARAVNQKGATFRHAAVFLTRARVDATRDEGERRQGTRKLDFQRQVWPLLLREMEHVYYRTLCGPAFAARYLAVAEQDEARAALLDEVEPGDRFSWAQLEDPIGDRSFASTEQFTAFLRDFIRGELEAAALGNVRGPLKAATDVLRDLRGDLRYAVEYGGLNAASHRWFDRVFWPTHNRVVAGPPAFRVEQLLALLDAGVLDLSAGPNPRLDLDAERGTFRLTPTAFPGEPREIDVLMDARIPMPNVRTDRSPLLQGLLSRGEIRPFVNQSEDATYVPCGVDITPDNRVIDVHGAPSETLSAMGILAEGTQLYTFVAAAPGVSAKPLVGR